VTEGNIFGRVTGWLRSVAPDRATLKTDLVAGLPGAIGSVPDGMAASVLAGVNPIHGLYASLCRSGCRRPSASTKLMVITTTSAAALAAGSALESLSPEDRPEALFLLTVIAGVAMVAAGVLRLGRFTHFVSQSVMIGFLSGMAINIIAGQIPDLTGAAAEGSLAVQKAWSVVTNASGIELASVLTGAAAFAIIVLLGRTRIAPFSAVVALAVPTIPVVLSGADVAQVMDQGDIPRGIPLPACLRSRCSRGLCSPGALAVAAIVLVQGVGVAESAPNEDGTRSNTNVDFIAQGIGNVGSGLFQGQPVGGSVGQTALNQSAGARTRWASILCGLWMLLILALFRALSVWSPYRPSPRCSSTPPPARCASGRSARSGAPGPRRRSPSPAPSLPPSSSPSPPQSVSASCSRCCSNSTRPLSTSRWSNWCPEPTEDSRNILRPFD
jgi:sulfate permease, SulP family